MWINTISQFADDSILDYWNANDIRDVYKTFDEVTSVSETPRPNKSKREFMLPGNDEVVDINMQQVPRDAEI